MSLTDEQLRRVLREAEQGGWSHLQLLDRLFAEPAARKHERSVARRIRDAYFPENKTLESFDWAFNAQAIDRVQMEELATGEFIRRAAARVSFVDDFVQQTQSLGRLLPFDPIETEAVDDEQVETRVVADP